jgi:hypothetical protein
LLTLPSCLVDDPPPFPESEQTPPRLDDHKALPLLNQIIFAQSGETLRFTIPVASEDAGDGLSAILVLDYNGGSVGTLAGQAIRPSTLDDTTRTVDLSWKVPPGSRGCHRVTLRVTHSRNLDGNHGPEVFNTADLAEAYWLADIDVDPTLGDSLTDCPGASRGTP